MLEPENTSEKVTASNRDTARDPHGPTVEIHCDTSGLPHFRKFQQKLAQDWDALQRKISRRHGAVDASCPQWPRLLVAAEDVAPSGWDGQVEKWPDLARANDRLRLAPVPTDVSTVAEDENEWDIETFLVEAAKEFNTFSLDVDPFTESLSLNTKDLVHSVDTITETSQDAFITSPRNAKDWWSLGSTELGKSSGNKKIARSPVQPHRHSVWIGPKTQLQVITPPHARSFPPQASDDGNDFLLQSSEEGTKSKQTLADESTMTFMEGAADSDVSTLRKSREPSTTQRITSQEHMIETLSYVHSCRDSLGQARYASERRRLELQSFSKGAEKYSNPTVLPVVRSREGSHIQAGKLQADLATEGRRAKHMKQAQSGSYPKGVQANVAVTPGNSPKGAQSNAAMTPAGKQTEFSSSREAQEGRAVFEYSSMCHQQKVNAPNLGSFNINALEAALGSVDVAPTVTPQLEKRGTLKDRSEKVAVPLNVSQWSIGDAPLVALAGSSLGKALEATECHLLRGNRLTCDGVSALASRLGQKTKIVDLSENAFGPRGLKALAYFSMRSAGSLLLLDLSCNRFSDTSVAELALSLQHGAKALEELCLADVKLGVSMRSGQQLGRLIDAAPRLTHLDLSYNMMQGEGAYALINGLYANGGRKGLLRRVNLAWNCLGRGPQHEHIARMLGSVLHDCDVLFHLDISFNHINAQDCLLISNGLRENHSLWGIHIEGNAAVVDADGFFIILHETEEKPVESQPVEEIKIPQVGKPKRKKDRKKGGANQTARQPESLSAATLLQVASQARLADASTFWQQEIAKREIVTLGQSATRVIQGALALPELLRSCEYAGVPVPPHQWEPWLEKVSGDLNPDLQDVYAGAKRCSGAHWVLSKSADGAAENSDATSRGPVWSRGVRNEKPNAVRCRSCWICSGWVEVPIVLKRSSISSAIGEGESVCALISIDNFSRPVVLQPEEGNKRWSGSRYLPPTNEPYLLIFQIGRRCVIAQDMPNRKLSDPLRFRLADPSYMSSGEQPVGKSTNDDSEVVEVYEVNLLDAFTVADQKLRTNHLPKDKHTIDTVMHDLQRSQAKPRLLVSRSVQQSLLEKEQRWTRAKSVWADHADLHDDQFKRHIMRCLDIDWSLARCKFQKHWSQSELDVAHKVLRYEYLSLWSLYQYFSTVGRQDKDGHGVSLAAFEKILADAGINLHTHIVSCIFLNCSRVPGSLTNYATITCVDGLVRWQFTEAIIRISEACATNDEVIGDAVKRIVTRHLAPLGTQFWNEILVFRGVVFTETIDDIFTNSIDSLKKCFSFFSDSRKIAKARPRSSIARMMTASNTTDNLRTLSVCEWMCFLVELGVLDDKLPERLAPYAHNVGAHVNPDAASSGRHFELSFVEFLLAFAWVFYVRSGYKSGTAQLGKFLDYGLKALSNNLLQITLEFPGSALQQPQHPDVVHWRLGMKWLSDLRKVIEHIYAVADDNRDGVLSLRELRFALAGRDIVGRLEDLGIEVEHVWSFFKMADLDGDGVLSPIEAMHGLARVKEALKRDEQALQLLREAFDRTGDPQQLVSKTMFEEAAIDETIVAKMRVLYLDFSLLDFWDFLEDKRPIDDPDEDAFTLEFVLTQYIEFRDPQRTGRELVVFLRDLFRRADVDGSGLLDRNEFVQVLSQGENLQELFRLGLPESLLGVSLCFTGEASADNANADDAEGALVSLFHLIDADASGTLEIDEVLQWFQQAQEIARQKDLQRRFSTRTGATTKVGKKMPNRAMAAIKASSKTTAWKPGGKKTNDTFGSSSSVPPETHKKLNHQSNSRLA